MVRVGRYQIGTLRRGAPKERITPLIYQPKDHALCVQKTSNRAQHLADQILWRWCNRQNIQVLSQCLNLSAGNLLGRAQRLIRLLALRDIQGRADEFSEDPGIVKDRVSHSVCMPNRSVWANNSIVEIIVGFLAPGLLPDF